jgi:methionyl-tRNA formyltransferase
VESLLSAGVEVAGILTAPDKPRGRTLAPRPLAFALRMEAKGLRLLKLPTLKTPSARDEIGALRAEMFLLASYGKMIPRSILDLFAGNTLNVHPSLLPKYRGAAPVQRALMDGVRETGVTIIRMVEQMDAGPVLATQALSVGPDDTAGEVLGRAAEKGAELLLGLLARFAKREPLEGVSQDEAAATFAPKIRPEERFIDWNQPGDRIHNLVRALNPHPYARGRYRDEQLIIHRTALGSVSPVVGLMPAEIALSGRRVFVGTKGKPIELVEVQREGRRPMSACDWAIGARLPQRARFES